VGEGREEDIVGLGHGAADGVLERSPDVKVFEVDACHD
jgi:hypothetical protein